MIWGGAPKFCLKNDLKMLPDQSIVFSVQIDVTSKKKKKRSSLKLSRFFHPICDDLQEKRSSLTLRRFFCPALGICY